MTANYIKLQIRFSKISQPSMYPNPPLRKTGSKPLSGGTDLVTSSLPDYVITNRLGGNRSFDQNHHLCLLLILFQHITESYSPLFILVTVLGPSRSYSMHR